MGADAYLVEPVEEEELIGTVRALLRLRQQEQANRHRIEKLSQTERRLLEATEAADCAMWDWDIQSDRLEWFGAHERLVGMRPGSFSGKIKAFTDILHPNDRERVWEKVQVLMARRESQFADEYRFIHPDGTVRWMSGTGRFYYDATGQAVRMTGVAQDITERKQALEALSGAEHRYRIIFEQAGVGVARIDSQTGRFERVNRKYCEIVGRTESELLATTYMSMTHPDDLDEELAAMERLRGGLVDSFAMEKRYVRKDESIVWVLCNVAPLWQPGEGATHHIDVIQDITDRKQAEAELERMRHQLAEGQRIANLGSWEYIAAAQTMVWSDEEKRIHGLDPSQPSPDYDTMLRRYTHPDDAAELDRRFRVTLRDGVPFENENRIIRSDGSIRWISNKALPYFDAAGKPVKYVGTTLDITQRKEAEIVLAAAKDQLQATLTASDIGTWRWDLTRNDLVTDINLKRLFSIGEGDEVPLERYVERIVPDDRDGIKRAIESAIREGGVYEEQSSFAWPVRMGRCDGSMRVEKWNAMREAPHGLSRGSCSILPNGSTPKTNCARVKRGSVRWRRQCRASCSKPTRRDGTRGQARAGAGSPARHPKRSPGTVGPKPCIRRTGRPTSTSGSGAWRRGYLSNRNSGCAGRTDAMPG
jgi:PAS domain S-box-containing protein